MPMLIALARLALVAVFAMAGISKLLNRDGSRTAMRDFGVPAPLIPGGAWLLPLLELACAAGLLIPMVARAAATATFALLLLFIVGIVISLARGRRPNC